MMNHKELFAAATDVALEAGNLIVKIQSKSQEIKKDGKDFLTEADLASEKLILEKLGKLDPAIPFLSEEAGGEPCYQGLQWIVDPVDGTMNYAFGDDTFGVSIALVEDSNTVFGVINLPRKGLLFSAYRAQGAWLNGKPVHVSSRSNLARARVYMDFPGKAEERAPYMPFYEKISAKTLYPQSRGCVTAGLADVARGVVDAYVHVKDAVYDNAAGYLLVQEAGGKATRLNGEEINAFCTDIVASNGILHKEILSICSS